MCARRRSTAIPITAGLLAWAILSGLAAAAPRTREAAIARDAASAAQAAPPADERLQQGKALTESRCTVCHGLSKVTTAGRSEPEWQRTVAEMVGLGAQLSDDEAGAVVAYLSLNYPGRPDAAARVER